MRRGREGERAEGRREKDGNTAKEDEALGARREGAERPRKTEEATWKEGEIDR